MKIPGYIPSKTIFQPGIRKRISQDLKKTGGPLKAVGNRGEKLEPTPVLREARE
jgi:hypothetical protein